MKKFTLFILAAAMSVSLGACQPAASANASASNVSTDAPTGKDDSPNVGMPNPFTDCQTLEEAEKITGFDFTVPEQIDRYSQEFIQVMDKSMIQVFFKSGEDEILVRKAVSEGDAAKDISGDYRDYAFTETLSLDNREFTLKGNDDKIYVVTWTEGDSCFSIGADAGLSRDMVKELVNEIN